jgi:hypothetical protein
MLEKLKTFSEAVLDWVNDELDLVGFLIGFVIAFILGAVIF